VSSTITGTPPLGNRSASGLQVGFDVELGWGRQGGPLRQVQLHPAELGEMVMDATAQALAAWCRLAGFHGGTDDRAGFLLHRAAVAGGLHAQLGLGALVEVADGEGGHGGRLLALLAMLSMLMPQAAACLVSA